LGSLRAFRGSQKNLFKLLNVSIKPAIKKKKKEKERGFWKAL